MARLFAMHDIEESLKSHLLRELRSEDEAVLLPQAQRNDQTGTYKNVVFRLHAAAKSVKPEIFTPDWYSGVSLIEIRAQEAQAILESPERRADALRKLADAIPSEMADPELQVGPSLDCDDDDCDKADWTAGFDGPSCFVGLFSAEHSRAPQPGMQGMDRVHHTTYLVCKAGSGLAGATFHSRFVQALRSGASLDQILEGKANGVGAQALRRIEKSGSRNRCRILLQAATALGLQGCIETVPDNSSRSRYRLAVASVDCSVNSIRKLVVSDSRTVYQYTTCVDSALSQGIVTLSNPANGLVLLLSEHGDTRFALRNTAYDAIPFATRRLQDDHQVINRVVAAHKEALTSGKVSAHPDQRFVLSHFVWKARTFQTKAEEKGVNVAPLALWGSHEREDFIASLARELGVANCQIVRLRPGVVCVSALEASKSRAILRNLSATIG